MQYLLSFRIKLTFLVFTNLTNPNPNVKLSSAMMYELLGKVTISRTGE